MSELRKKDDYRRSKMPVFSLYHAAVMIVVLSCIVPYCLANKTHTHRVLILNSYHPTMEWAMAITNSIEAELKSHESNISYEIEYMDTKFFSDAEYYKNLLNLYKNKARYHKYDVIITTDNNALLFMLKYRDQLYPDVPIVFCGVDTLHPSMHEWRGLSHEVPIADILGGHKNITGVIEKLGYDSAIKVALTLHRSAKEVIVVNDGINEGSYWPKLGPEDIDAFKKKFGPDVQFSELLLNKETAKQLLSRIKGKEDQFILMLVGNFMDEQGNTFFEQTYWQQFWKQCKSPVYVIAKELFGVAPVVGGNIDDPSRQGLAAADLAIRVLEGHSAESIPIIEDSPNTYMFDYRQMKRFGISRSELPEGSVILNLPAPSFYQQYKTRIWFVILVIAGLGVMVLILLANIFRRKIVENELKESQVRYKTLFESSADGILITDTETRQFKYANPALCAMLGYKEKELTKMTVSQLHPPEDYDRVIAEFDALSAEEKTLAQDIPFVRKDSSIVYVDINSAVTEIDGRKCGIGFLRDITYRKEAEEALRNARDELELRVEKRTADLATANQELRNEISERMKVEGQLRVYQRQLRSLASELSLAEEKLRRRIATDIHDHIGQTLAMSKIKIESLAQSVGSPEYSNSLKAVSKMIAEAIQSTRTLTFELSPPVLYELGFVPAVEWLTRQSMQRDSLKVTFKDDDKPKPLSDNVRVLLFQAVRELLVNVAKHSKATSVRVSIKRRGDEVRVTVEDNGVGFSMSPTDTQIRDTDGFGLFSIGERLGYVDGRMEIKSVPGVGTKVTVTAPVDNSKNISQEENE